MNLLSLKRAYILFLVLASSSALAYNSNVQRLKEMQQRSRNNLESIDREMMQAYSETAKISPQDVTNNSADQTLNYASEKVNALMDRKKEEVLRIAFLDQLIFKISSIPAANLKEALPRVIDSLAHSEMGIGTNEVDGNKSSIKFKMNLATAIRTLPEPIEEPLSFLETYLEFSTISNPRPISEFRNNQNYINEIAKPAQDVQHQ